MHATLNTDDLHPLLQHADRAARRICRNHRLPWFDVDDARQDLLLDLLCRVRHHDPSRSPLWNFATICFRHRGQRLEAVLRRERHHCHLQSLDVVLPDADHLTLVDTLTNEDGVGFWLGQDVHPIAQSELRHDLDRALGGMDAATVLLCAALLHHAMGGDAPALSRPTLHRRVRDLRCRLLAAGVGRARKTTRSRREY